MLNLKGVDRGLNFLEKIETFIAALAMIFIVLINFLDIICRYFLFGSLGWPQELSLYLIVWFTYFSLSVLIKKKELIKIDFFYNKFSKNVRKIIILGYNVTLCIVFIFILKYSFELKRIQEARNLITLSIPRAIGLYGFMIALVSILFFVSIDLYKECFKKDLITRSENNNR